MNRVPGVVEQVVDFLSGLEQVNAVALAGSWAAGTSDASSDLDLYAYVSSEIPVNLRTDWIRSRAARYEIDNRFWETGDEWIEKGSGIPVDVMYRDPHWFEDQMDRVLMRHQASVGYTTCFWANLLNSEILYDRSGWLAALKKSADRPYPEELRCAIVRKNYPILAANISSYARQIEKAVARQDPVNLNHRVAAFLASYFDILFAVNRVPHPGEKRVLEIASQRCRLRPPDLGTQVEALIRNVAIPQQALDAVLNLVHGLDTILRIEDL